MSDGTKGYRSILVIFHQTAVFCLLVSLMITSTYGDYQVCVNRSHPVLTDEQRLLMVLMEDYDSATRPVYNASDTVNVSIGMTLTQIFDVDERNQVLTLNIWLDQEWHDEKLHWNPEDFGGIKMLRIPCKKLWLPDIVLYNSADDYTDGYMQALAMVGSSGDVFWPPIVKFRSTCQIDTTYFPFDDQICYLKMGSWAYDGFQVDIFNRSEPVDLSNYVANGEWELVNLDVRRSVVHYPCCPEPFPDVTFAIHIRRKTLYYTYNVIVPCVMLSMLTLLGFWMRPDSGEKVTLGLTVLLTFCVFMLLIAENMPATSTFVPLIGLYLTSVMGLTSLSVILAVSVSNINARGTKEEGGVPPRLKRFLLKVATILCMKASHLKQETEECVRIKQLLKKRSTHHSEYNMPFDGSESGCNLIDYENNHTITSVESPSVDALKMVPERGGISIESEVILTRLQLLITRDLERDRIGLAYKEWQEAAEIVDRLLFIVYMCGTLTVTGVLLFVVPLSKRVKLWDR